MALSDPTGLWAGTNTSNNATIASGSVSPTANALLTVGGMMLNSASTAVSSITDTFTGTGSWTIYQVEINGGSPNRYIRGWLAHAIAGSSPGTGAVTTTLAASSRDKSMNVAEITGHDTGTPVEGNAINTGTGAALTVTTGTTPDANDMVIGVFADRVGSVGITPGTGFTELTEQNTGNAGHNFQYDRTGADTSCDASGLNSIINVGLAFVVNEAASGVTVALSTAALTFSGVGLQVNQTVRLDSAALNTVPVAFQINQTVGLSTATLALAGAVLQVDQTVRLSSGALSVTGVGLTVIPQIYLSLNAAALTLSGVSLKVGQTVGLSTAPLTLAGVNFEQINQTVVLSSGALTLAGVSLQVNQTVELSSAVLTLAGVPLTASVGGALSIALNTASLTLSGVVLQVNRTVNLDSAALTLAGVGLQVNQTVVLDSAGLVLAGVALQVDQTVDLDAASLTLSGVALQVNRTVVLSSGALTLSGVPLAQINQTVPLSSAGLAITGVDLVSERVITLSTAALSLTGVSTALFAYLFDDRFVYKPPKGNYVYKPAKGNYKDLVPSQPKEKN